MTSDRLLNLSGHLYGRNSNGTCFMESRLGLHSEASQHARTCYRRVPLEYILTRLGVMLWIELSHPNNMLKCSLPEPIKQDLIWK